jgi:hypothetical protein
MALAVGVLALLALVFVATETWLRLVAGYQLHIGFEGGPRTTYDIVFPFWRKLLEGVVLVVLAGGILLGMFGRSRAFSAIVVGIAGVAALGLYDVWEYGTIGSPTSKWTGFLVAALLAAAMTGKWLRFLK